MNEPTVKTASRRQYNQFVAREDIEDYALRYTPASFRRWSGFTVANTAIGGISFLALEAIGASIALTYGFTNAFWGIFAAAVIIFTLGFPISYQAAKHNIDIDLLTRAAGFGYLGSTATSLIYASFCFIFFALEAAIMAQALFLYTGLPLSIGYALCSVIIIPVVFYGMTAINRLQMFTQPVWLVLMILPFVMVLIKEPAILDSFFGFAGSESAGDAFSWHHFGFAMGISLALIAQIGEQVDYLRFMPRKTPQNRIKWWAAVVMAGPGWIVLGFLKQIGGIFLAALVLLGGASVVAAKEPIHMYNAAYLYVFENPGLALAVSFVFVMVSQIKINVTNAYAGSLAWSNFFSRTTHTHPGRVVWLLFNISIALLLMQMGVFEVLEKILGLYSNIAIAWVATLFADLAINKPLGLSPRLIEFRRAHLFNINPVGIFSTLIASVLAIVAFSGLLGLDMQAFSSLIAMVTALILTPLIAWITGGKYYIAREADLHGEERHRCGVCGEEYSGRDMASCAMYSTHICSLCCSLDARCHDLCKVKKEFSLRDWILDWGDKLSGGRFRSENASRFTNFSLVFMAMMMLIGFILWTTYIVRIIGVAPADLEAIQTSFLNVFYIFALVSLVGSWVVVLMQESREYVEKELTEKNAELEGEIQEREKVELALQEARDVAEEATRAKSDFLANMSHEIRTPMNAIIGLSHLASGTDLDRKQRDYLSKISASAGNLLQIINDILDFSKIEAGKLDMERIDFDLQEVLNNFANVVSVKSAEKGLELIIDIADDVPAGLKGDPLRLNQILINLANNAVKFTEQGEIAIRIETLAQGEDAGDENVQLRVGVRDTGIGMTEAQRGRLFQAFSQADTSTSRKFGGTGLGLTISKRLVEMMDGEIGVNSEPGVGSEFFFTAHFGRGVKPRRSGPKVLPEDLQGIRVLVVDDNTTSRIILARYLESFGFFSGEAQDGQHALTELKNAEMPYNLVLMDWKMPGMDGIEATSRIFSDDHLSLTPKVIMLTAYGREEIREQAEDVGVETFLVKPVNPSTLLEAILETFGHEVQHESSSREEALAAENVRGAHLLLVEDNEINQQVAGELLNQAGLTIDIAANGQIGVDMLSASPGRYDGVLMDIQMPIMDGYTATREIRKDARFQAIPIIAMTANAFESDREKAKDAGMNDHIAKPIDVKELFQVLGQWIEVPEVRRVGRAHQEQLQESEQQVGTAHPTVPALAGIDTETGLRRVGGNHALYLKILNKFRQSQADVIERIKKADPETAQREAHTLKGLAGNIGAEQVQVAAGDVEAIFREGKGKLTECLEALEASLKPVIDSLTDAGADSSAKEQATSPDQSSASVEELLSQLRELLEDDDSDALEVVESLLSQVEGSATEATLRHIATLVEDYDFELALEQLESLTGGTGSPSGDVL